MQEELRHTAISLAYSSLEPSTYKLLQKSETRLAKLPRFWYIGIFTPQLDIYEQLVDQLQPLTESLSKVMGSFRVGICTYDDPIPPGGSRTGVVADRFLIDMTWYYQITNLDHPSWCEVAPEHLIQALP
jgi:hypothetical protein